MKYVIDLFICSSRTKPPLVTLAASRFCQTRKSQRTPLACSSPRRVNKVFAPLSVLFRKAKLQGQVNGCASLAFILCFTHCARHSLAATSMLESLDAACCYSAPCWVAVADGAAHHAAARFALLLPRPCSRAGWRGKSASLCKMMQVVTSSCKMLAVESLGL